MTTYHFTRVSMNRKTGPMPVTTTSSDSCPTTCNLKGAGCYAEHGNLKFHWNAVDRGERGCTFEELLEHIRKLPRGQLWRLNQAGDLPPSAVRQDLIDLHKLLLLAAANRGRKGFTYTHYPPTGGNRAAVRAAVTSGFTISWSAENLDQADQFADFGVAPVVSVLPADVSENARIRTRKGRKVMVCPATNGKTDCLHCGICAEPNRQFIVGFPAHGTRVKKVNEVFFANQQLELTD